MSNVTVIQPDVTLMLDDEGVIREATLANSIADEGVGSWVGRPWLETVGGDGVRGIVEDARSNGIAAFRRVVQRFPSGLELPIEYTTVRADSQRGGLVAMGRNLQAVAELQSRLAAAQQATEQEYWKLRELETRYRLLFDASVEAVLMIGAEDFRIVEANPAAVRALGLAPGWEFLAEVAPGERDGFRAMLLQVREHGRAPGLLLHIGADAAAWMVRASMMASEPGLRYLLHISPAGARPAKPVRDLSLDVLIDRLPDGFVALGPDGRVLRANRAFLDLVQAGAEGTVLDQPLDRWLSRPGFQLSDLLDAVRRHGALRVLPTSVVGEFGAETDVEASAVGNRDSDPQVIGVLLRDVSRRALAAAPDSAAGLLGAMTRQLGAVPLPQLVRETTAAIERHFILAALQQAAGNRTAAAELLGLSRQSLHSKLNRYGDTLADKAAADT